MLEHAQTTVIESSTSNRHPLADALPHRRVISRSGEAEFFDSNKIAQAVTRASDGLIDVDVHQIVARTISSLYDGATTRELDERCMHAAAGMGVENPQYTQVAARLLHAFIDKELSAQGVYSFSQSIRRGFEQGLVNERVCLIVEAHQPLLDNTIDVKRNTKLDYLGLRTLYDRYLLKHPTTHEVLESPQYMWMRMAVSLSASLDDALVLYRHFSLLDYVPSAAILHNAGSQHEQLSSCFVLDPPQGLMASNSLHAATASGDRTVAWHGVRNGTPMNANTELAFTWLEQRQNTEDSANMEDVAADGAEQAACVFLEPWNAEILDFLADSPASAGANHLNLAHWVSDLFMQRVEDDQTWSLFESADVPELSDLFGAAFDEAYQRAEARGHAKQVMRARDLYEQMMLNIAQTGNGWITFKDKANRACNQTGMSGNMVHLSGPCTEIMEVTKHGDTAICNLGTINLARHVTASGFDFQKLAHTVRVAVRQLDQVIDLNTYPAATAKDSNLHWRPVGLGAMGLQDVFFTLRLPFDSYEARLLSTQIAETIYFHALQSSMEAAREYGAHEGFAETRAAQGELQFDAWGVTPSSAFRWDELRAAIKRNGLRNSLLIAIAPTADLAAIAGCYECIEPQVSNVLDRHTSIGMYQEFNRYLVADVQEAGFWTDKVRRAVIKADGSVQGLYELPEQMRTLYRTAWELSALSLIDLAADRGAFVDQSQSLRLFMADPNVRQLSRLYMYAWKSGLKTTYLVRSRWPRDRATEAVSNASGASGAGLHGSAEHAEVNQFHAS